MQVQFPMFRLAGPVLTGLVACVGAGAQNAAAPVGVRAPTTATVLDATGSVMFRRGAGSTTAARGATLQAGDQVYILENSSLTLGCPEQNAVKITTVGTFTFSGCQPAKVAAQPPAAGPAQPATTAAAEPAPASGPVSAPEAPVPRKSGGGATLGIIGGVALAAAAAGGGGGGGGSKPASP